MNNKLTFTEIMNKYVSGEINQNTKIKFKYPNQKNIVEEQKLIDFIQDGWTIVPELNFEIVKQINNGVISVSQLQYLSIEDFFEKSTTCEEQVE